MCKVVELLKQTLQPYRTAHHFIVSADAYRALSSPCLACFRESSDYVSLHPCPMTWVLQPCATHVFAQLKNTLCHECPMRTVASANGHLTMTMLLQALAATISLVLRNVCWRSAFWELGLTGVQACLSQRLLDKLEMSTRPYASDDLPTLQNLQDVFPNRAV